MPSESQVTREDHAWPAPTRRPRRSWKKTLLWVIGVAVVLFVLIQFVPYGRTSHTNPPATNPFKWTDPQAEAIARRSCYDCHSNETKWWWATNIAPFSWLVQHDVDGGRARLNFSDCAGEPSAACVQAGRHRRQMPPIQYTLIHPNAKLTDAEKQTLVTGLPERARRERRGVERQSAERRPSARHRRSGDGAAHRQLALRQLPSGSDRRITPAAPRRRRRSSTT